MQKHLLLVLILTNIYILNAQNVSLIMYSNIKNISVYIETAVREIEKQMQGM